QRLVWPRTGRHILAQYDDASVVVYQAYRADIADHAITHQAFGGPWSFDRMSWIKPNFLWMMYRSGWATKPDQERVLAIRLRRDAFDTILRRSVESSHHPEVTGWERDEWQRRGRRSDVRLQWDPDHHPSGAKLERRAVQLGLRGNTLARFANDWILRIHDLTVEVFARRADSPLLTPRERVYRPEDPELCRWLRLSDATSDEPDSER
ncbi:MAG: DUF4291 domain-containing protein, partial [Myxococcota bacterium]